MTTTELSELIIAKLGVKPWDLSNEPFGVRFDYRSSRYFVDINLMVEKVDGSDSDARQLEKLQHGEQWDGTGLPPVGAKCEIIINGGDLGLCEILFVGASLLVWRQESTSQEGSGYHRHMNFRPLRTERDKAIEQISDICGVFAITQTSEQLYDAIVAGKIDGLGKVD